MKATCRIWSCCSGVSGRLSSGSRSAFEPDEDEGVVWLERLSLGTGTGTGFTLASLLLEHLATKREARCLVFAAAQLVVRCCDRAPVQTGDHPSDRSPFSFRSGPPAAPC